MLRETGAATVPFIICTAIWAFAGGGDFWPIWLLLIPLITLVRNVLL